MTRNNLQLQDAQAHLRTLYAGETFQRAAGCWTKTLADHFRNLESGSGPVLHWADAHENISLAAEFLAGPKPSPTAIDAWLPDFTRLLQTMLTHGQNLHHPRYLGHQVPASIPIAALFDAIGSVTNQVMAIYEMGPWATSVERAMIETLGAEIGYAPDSFAGLITSGGSLANLTCLLTARNVVLQDAWTHGVRDAQSLALLVQADAHYCISRAVGILGLGTQQILKIPVDDQRRMRTDALRSAIQDTRRQGKTIVATVACACATPVGAFDPLPEIADICEQEQIWLHVDAAHGGAALLSESHRHLVKGLERADSVVWDAHKMLFVPALCAFAFYKNKAHRFAAFQQDAPYLFDPSNPGMAEYDSGTQTLECTKRAAAFGIWGIWSLFGRQMFRNLVDVTFDLCQQLHTMLDAAPDFQPLHVPQCNIQVFRYLPDAVSTWSEQDVGNFQLQLRRRLITGGNAYIVPIKIDSVGALRATLINPNTTHDDMQAVLDEVRTCGTQLLAE